MWTRNHATGRYLSPRARRAARLGTGGFVVANLLVALAFVTNVEPMPYYPWLSLPVAPLPAQPRLGHYPASYTLGLWLWEFTVPAVLLLAGDRATIRSDRARRAAFVAVPALITLGFFAYCRFVFPQPTPSVWEPAVTVVCYAYCQTYAPAWAAATVGTGLLGLGGALIGDSRPGRSATVAFGLLAFPLGLVALYEVGRRRQSPPDTDGQRAAAGAD